MMGSCSSCNAVVCSPSGRGWVRERSSPSPSAPARVPPLAEKVACQIRDLMTKGALGAAAILTTDDCRATYEELRAKGVEFTEEPTEQPYGIDCALRDPFGNHVRITQPAAGPVEVRDEDMQRWQG